MFIEDKHRLMMPNMQEIHIGLHNRIIVVAVTSKRISLWRFPYMGPIMTMSALHQQVKGAYIAKTTSPLLSKPPANRENAKPVEALRSLR